MMRHFISRRKAAAPDPITAASSRADVSGVAVGGESGRGDSWGWGSEVREAHREAPSVEQHKDKQKPLPQNADL
jgi:hypothetical protein